MCPGSSPCDDYIATGECRSVGSLVFFCGVGLKPRGREVCVCVCESGKGGGGCFVNTDGRQKVVSWRNRLTEELIRACSYCQSVSTLFLSYYLFHPRGFKTLRVCETICGTNRMFVEINCFPLQVDL